MKVSYDKLFLKLKENGIKQTDFFNSVKFGGTTIKKLRNNDSVTTNTICRICDFFKCMPDEIMDFIPDSDYPEEILEKQRQIEEIESQIAALQEKLKNI